MRTQHDLPRVAFFVESFCYSLLLHCDITLYGKVQIVDGKVLSQAVRVAGAYGSIFGASRTSPPTAKDRILNLGE